MTTNKTILHYYVKHATCSLVKEPGKSEEHLPLTTVLLAKSCCWSFMISSLTLSLLVYFSLLSITLLDCETFGRYTFKETLLYEYKQELKNDQIHAAKSSL